MYVGHLMPGVLALALDARLPTFATLLAGTWVDLICGIFVTIGLDRVSLGATHPSVPRSQQTAPPARTCTCGWT